MSETYTPPKSAINNAKRGLDLRKKYGRGGLTPAEAKSYGIDSGITRAKRISKGKLSRHDVRRMSAFNRHRQNYNPSKKMGDGGPTAGTIAWLLWGGTSGVNWAKKKSAAMNAESFEAEIFESQGTLKFTNRETLQLLFNENWKCSHCNNIIKNKQNIPFSEEEQNNITWAMLANEYDLTNYDDINIIRKKPRGSKGNNARIDGELNFDNLLLLCHSCHEKRFKEKEEQITFRTSKEKKEWLEHLAKKKDKGMAEIMNDIVDEYRNNYEEESFEAKSKMDKTGENFSSDWTEKSFDDGGGYDYTCMLILDIRDASKDYPLYTRIEEGSGFALKPLAIIKIKELILSGLNLNGVDYAGTTITAESIIFKFNFNNLDEAEDYFKYLNQYISIMMAKNHDEIPDNELCPHCMFSKVLLEVVDKYELGIKIANLIGWSNKEQTIDFLEYLIALENVDMEYTLNLLRERGANISKPNDYNGNSTKQLIVAEKNGYESMIEYIINELENKKRIIDVVAFTLIADNGLKEQITNNIEQILKIDYSQLSSNLQKQLYLNQGKLAGIEDFLYYFYSDSSDFIFDNI